MASKTFTEQVNTPLVTGSTLWAADGEGLHSHIYFDAVRGLNNLAVKSGNYAVYAQGVGGGQILRSYTGAGREVFMAQLPIIVPPWRYRLLWTAGVTAVSGTVSTVTTYLSPKLYNGDAVLVFDDSDVSPTPTFDTTNIPHSGSHSVSMGGLAASYGLADDSTTGLLAPSSIAISLVAPTVAFVVVTITGGSDSSFLLNDFSCWFAEQ